MTRNFPSTIAIMALTVGGRRMAAEIAGRLDAEVVAPGEGIKKTMARSWQRYDGFVLIMAAGVAVRAIAPLLNNKKNDPAVVVMDEHGRFAISLVSGHLGCANELARRAAALSGGKAVITTASDVTGHTAVDLWLRDHGIAAGAETVTRASAILVNHGLLHVDNRIGMDMPADFAQVNQAEDADLIITREGPEEKKTACCRLLFLGAGCNRGTRAAEFEIACAELLRRHGLPREAIAKVASIDLKKDEAGLVAFAEKNGWPLVFYNKEQLKRIPVAEPSAAVLRATGVGGVAEPAAISASGNGKLIIRKHKWKNVTLAVACSKLSEPAPETEST